MDERRRHPKDLGEIMVIAHAVVAAESGHSVTILMADRAAMRDTYNRLRGLDDGLPPIEKLTC